MRIIQPSFEILEHTPDMELLIERAIRTAYKSEDRICEGSAEKIIDLIKSKKHESCLEHGVITVRIICDRGISHEFVRHRIASFTQESTRYVDYSKGKHGGGIGVIDPYFWKMDSVMRPIWVNACEYAEKQYLTLLKSGATAQEARSVLPNSTKTEIVMTCNVREWRTIFNLRSSNAAHPQMRQIVCPMVESFRKRWSILFNDVGQTDHECPAKELFSDAVDILAADPKEYFKEMLLNGTHLKSFEDEPETCNIISKEKWLTAPRLTSDGIVNPYLSNDKLNAKVAQHFPKFMSAPVALDNGIHIEVRSFKFKTEDELLIAVKNGISKYLYSVYSSLVTNPKNFITATNTYTLRVGFTKGETNE